MVFWKPYANLCFYSSCVQRLVFFTMDEYVESGQSDKIHHVLTVLFANITHTTEIDLFEHYFQTVIYLVFILLGRFSICELHIYIIQPAKWKQETLYRCMNLSGCVC